MHLVLNRYLRFYPVLTVYHREWTLTRPSDRGLYPSCSCDMMIMQQELRFFPTKGKNRHFPQYACFFLLSLQGLVLSQNVCYNQSIPNEKGIAQWTDDKGFAEGGRGCATGNKDAGDAILPAEPRHTKEIPVTEMWPVFFCMDTKQKKDHGRRGDACRGLFFFSVTLAVSGARLQ